MSARTVSDISLDDPGRDRDGLWALAVVVLAST
jgi:L-aminopeptidase/D-esterase-like protein